MVQRFDFTDEFGVLVPSLLAGTNANQISFSPLWHSCDKPCTVCCQSHCLTQPPLFTPHMNCQPTMSKVYLTHFYLPCYFHSFSFHTYHYSLLHSCDFTLTIGISHFTSATGFLKRHFSGNLSNCLTSLRGFPFSLLKYFKHFISPLKPSKALINNYSSLLVESKVLFDTLLKCEVIHVCFFRKNSIAKTFGSLSWNHTFTAICFWLGKHFLLQFFRISFPLK